MFTYQKSKTKLKFQKEEITKTREPKNKNQKKKKKKPQIAQNAINIKRKWMISRDKRTHQQKRNGKTFFYLRILASKTQTQMARSLSWGDFVWLWKCESTCEVQTGNVTAAPGAVMWQRRSSTRSDDEAGLWQWSTILVIAAMGSDAWHMAAIRNSTMVVGPFGGQDGLVGLRLRLLE